MALNGAKQKATRALDLIQAAAEMRVTVAESGKLQAEDWNSAWLMVASKAACALNGRDEIITVSCADRLMTMTQGLDVK